MTRSVLIIEDSASTANLARLALADVACEVRISGSPPAALQLVQTSYSPCVLVVDTSLPGVQTDCYCDRLHQAVPGAAVVLLLHRGLDTPHFPLTAAKLYKPLEPRRFSAVIQDLLVAADSSDGR